MLRIENVGLRLHGYRSVRVLAATGAGLWALAAAALTLLAALPVRDGSLGPAAEALGDAASALGLLGLLSWIAALFALAFARTALTRFGVIELLEEGVRIEHDGAARVVPYEAVRAGWYDPAALEVVLTLERGDVLRVGPLERPQAELLADAVAAGATERALDLVLRRDISAQRAALAGVMIPLVFLALTGVASLESVPALVAAAAALGVAWYLVLSRFGAPERVIVGHDGVALEGARGARFLPYARVLEASPSVDGVVLTLLDTSRVPILLFQPRAGRPLELSLKRRDHLLARIRAELAAFRGGAAEPLGAALLDRRGRTLPAWRAALRELIAQSAVGYRAAAIDPDHLVRILEARDAPAERRLGAALALSESGDPALQRRVRVFIDTCAGDDLRGAIEEAAAGELDDAGLERAVARLERP